jgi:hypothetical protein
MFDQFMDGIRRTSESSFQMQQEVFRQWTRMWGQMPPGVGGATEWGRASQKRWVDLGVEMLNKHREGLDATYKAGIELIQQAFSVSDAKSPDDYRRMTEDLWRRLFDLQKQQAENQFRDFQTLYDKSATIVQEGAKVAQESAKA